MPVLGRREVGGRRAGGVVMGAPQVVDTLPSQTTGRERILPVMRYLQSKESLRCREQNAGLRWRLSAVARPFWVSVHGGVAQMASVSISCAD